MPEVVARRVGSLFSHRDTRLAETGHPIVVKSVDMADLGPRFARHQIRFEYGYGGDERLYVEIGVYKPGPATHWLHCCFDVQRLIEGARPEDLKALSKRLRVPMKLLVDHLVRHALWPN